MRNTLKPLIVALVVVAASTQLIGCAQDTVDSSQIAAGKPVGGSTGQSDSSSNNIDRSYMLVAEEGSSAVSLVATFRMAGTWSTTVRLSPPAQLLFDGQRLSDSQLISKEGAMLTGILLPVLAPFAFLASGTHYSGNSSGLGPHTLEWTDQTGRLYRDQMSVSPCSMQSSPSVISIGQSSTWVVNAPGSFGGVSYSARLEQTKADRSSAFASASSSSGRLSFSAADLKQFESGSATLKIECETTTNLDSSGSGSARGTSIYKLQDKTVTVVL